MRGYLAAGTLAADGSGIVIDDAGVALEPPVQLSNIGFEAVMPVDGGLLTFFEANGARVNPHPSAPFFGLDLKPRGAAPLPAVEYRITDVTPPEATGRFWAANVFYVGDKQLLADVTHSVEQILTLRWDGRSVAATDVPPIRLQRLDDRVTRNWEAIARLDDRGFLLATDTCPETLLGFVADPPSPR
jgi:hypothetical protein